MKEAGLQPEGAQLEARPPGRRARRTLVPRHRLGHDEFEDAQTEVGGERALARRVVTQTPLDRYLRRGLIDRRQHDAGQALARDWHYARMEAQHASIFVAGWRPFIGWVLGLGVAYSFLLGPIVGGIVSVWKPGFTLPTVDEHLWELIFAMLGMGALRSFDKLRGADAGRAPAASPPWQGRLEDAIRNPRA
jgi:hypothetical protein